MTPASDATSVAVLHIDLPEHSTPSVDETSPRMPLDVLGDVAVQLEIRLGTARPQVRELLGLCSGSLLTLDQHILDDVDVLLNGRVVARGEIVAVGDHFGVRIKAVSASRSKHPDQAVPTSGG